MSSYVKFPDQDVLYDLDYKSYHAPKPSRPRFPPMLRVLIACFAVLALFSALFLLWISSGLVLMQYYEETKHHPMILISMDGFRHDYIEIVKERRGPQSLPNFDRLLLDGVRVLKCVNSYPTITAPNHQTIVTGVHPQRHGIIANTIWDTNNPEEVFNLDVQSSLDTSHWILNGTKTPLPIWVELQQQGFVVGSMLWPFVDQPIEGQLPQKMQSEYATLNEGDHGDKSMRYSKRVDRVLRWLSDPTEQADFVMLYFEEPDAVGHAYGPNSGQLIDMVMILDKALGQLYEGLDKLQISANIILTADHGMTELSDDKLIHVNDCLQPGTYNYTWLSTSGFLYASNDSYNDVYQRLQTCHANMSAYKLLEVPQVENFNFPPASRSPDFVLMADPGWVMVDSNRTTRPIAGNHGYSVTNPDMNPILIFSGPDFYSNQTSPTLHTIDIYGVIVNLFLMKGHSNDGHLPSGISPKFP